MSLDRKVNFILTPQMEKACVPSYPLQNKKHTTTTTPHLKALPFTKWEPAKLGNSSAKTILPESIQYIQW